MVRVTNNRTKWDNRAGRYITLSVSGYSYSQWFRLNVKHYSTYKAPVILHPQLLKRYYPYLDDDGSGHFQVGRGWDYNRDSADDWWIGYYEPWNQQRFNASEPFISRKQWRWAWNSYKANLANAFENIGV